MSCSFIFFAGEIIIFNIYFLPLLLMILYADTRRSCHSVTALLPAGTFCRPSYSLPAEYVL